MLNLRIAAVATLILTYSACVNPALPRTEQVTPFLRGTASQSGAGGVVSPRAAASSGIGFGSGGRADTTTAATAGPGTLGTGN